MVFVSVVNTRISTSLAGAATPGRQQRDSFHDDARVYFSGWMLRQVRNQESVESVLGGYFGIPVQVVPWDGHWEALEPADCTRLLTWWLGEGGKKAAG